MSFRESFRTFPEIATKRLRLREFVGDDAAGYFDGLNTVDRAVWGLRWESVDQTCRQLQVWPKGFKAKAGIHWAIIERKTESLLGEVKMFDFVYQSKAEIAYWLSARHRRKGYGSEAVAAVVGFGFAVLELHRIEAYARPDNAGSCGLLEKVGFVREGLLRKFRCEGGHDGAWNDQVVYGMLRKEWA